MSGALPVVCPHCGASFDVQRRGMSAYALEDHGFPRGTSVLVRIGVIGEFPGVVLGHTPTRVRVRVDETPAMGERTMRVRPESLRRR